MFSVEGWALQAATVEALLAEARAAATVPEPEPPRGGLLRRRRG